MSKTYFIHIHSNDGKGIMPIVERLSLRGTKEKELYSAQDYGIIYTPNEDKENARTIRTNLGEVLRPFEDTLIIAGINAYDYIDTSKVSQETIEEEQRNFNRFNTMREAKMAYDLEKPRWVYSDGKRTGQRVEFDEWVWLPIKQSGIYEASKYKKYV